MKKIIHRWVATGQTADAVTLLSLNDPNTANEKFPDESCIVVEATFVGRNAATGVAVTAQARASYATHAAALALQGAISLPALIGNAGMLTSVCTLAAGTGLAVKATVLGIAATTIDWMVHVTWTAYQP